MNTLKEYVDSLIESGIPYIDVVCHRDGEEILRMTAGANATGKEKLNIFSCSKPITMAMTMRLVEEGKISLDDPVEKYLPTFADVYLLRDGVRCAPKKRPTLRNLATMTAGITYNIDGYYPIEKFIAENPTLSPTVAAMMSIPSMPLAREVGERFDYTLCHDVMGAVLEVASGESLSALLKKYITEPLGMENTYYGSRFEESTADPYRANPDGSISPTTRENAFVLCDGFLSGGAGLVSTVEDYIKFVDMLALGGIGANGARVLTEESVKIMRTPEIASIGLAGDYTSISNYGYGIGVRTRTVPTEWGLPVGEFGWDGAAGSYLMADPVNRTSVFIGMNVRVWPIVMKGKHLEIVKRIYSEHGIGK